MACDVAQRGAASLGGRGCGTADVLGAGGGRVWRGLGQGKRRGRGEGGGAVLRLEVGRLVVARLWREGAGLPAVQEVLKLGEQCADVAVDAQEQERHVGKLRHAPGKGAVAGGCDGSGFLALPGGLN